MLLASNTGQYIVYNISVGEQYDLDIKYSVLAMSFDHLNMLKLFHHYLNTHGPTMLCCLGTPMMDMDKSVLFSYERRICTIFIGPSNREF